ncbi:hypothetical protein [Flavobacterium agrisoli]|uniref:Uncharacterized protein n=1 Tax=Flavobacterium agrisoli TaxID=2793066 RepID=A0A934PR53_9FLAO|nr:hypothetical protein [Flavobacterium agrisoli]MBK0371076.1 hypothetical protein [Flavobacterium agrisoli]
MRFHYFLLLVVFSLSAQNNVLEIKIDSITSKDSSEFLDREFTISYHIKNLTEKEVSFFLNPNKFLPSISSSMSYATTYRLFQNENPIDASQVIKSRRKSYQSKDRKETIRDDFMNKDSIKSNLKKWENDSLYFWKKKNKDILSSILVLKPREKKEFKQKIYWNKNRYTKTDDLEYYLEENLFYTLQIELILLKKEFADRLTTEELNTFLKDPNFLEGYYYSNKAEINFKE